MSDIVLGISSYFTDFYNTAVMKAATWSVGATLNSPENGCPRYTVLWGHPGEVTA